MGGHYEKGIYNQLMDVMARLDAMEAEYKKDRKEITMLTSEVVSLRKENASLRIEVSQLREKDSALEEKCGRLEKENCRLFENNERLKGILNNNSSNTSNPPSTDQKIRSGKCVLKIKNIGDTSTGKYIIRYIMDLDVKPVVTEIRIYADANGKFIIPEEYRSCVTYGPCVKSLAVMLYSEGVMANDRIAGFLNAVGGDSLGLSEGSICHFCSDFSRRAGESISHLKEEQLAAPVAAADATVVTVNGKQCYIRNFGTDRTVL